MSDPRLEPRYFVFKISHLTDTQRRFMIEAIEGMDLPTVDCVVIEEDWPEYDPTVNLLWERINGV